MERPPFVFTGTLKPMATPPDGGGTIIYAEPDEGSASVDAFGGNTKEALDNLTRYAGAFVAECHRRGIIDDGLANGFLVKEIPTEGSPGELLRADQYRITVQDPRNF